MHKSTGDRWWRRDSESPESRFARLDDDELSHLIHLTDDAKDVLGLSLRVEMLRDLILRGGKLTPTTELEFPNDRTE